MHPHTNTHTVSITFGATPKLEIEKCGSACASIRMDDGVEIRPILTAQSSGGWIDAFILFPQASSDIRDSQAYSRLLLLLYRSWDKSFHFSYKERRHNIGHKQPMLSSTVPGVPWCNCNLMHRHNVYFTTEDTSPPFCTKPRIQCCWMGRGCQHPEPPALPTPSIGCQCSTPTPGEAAGLRFLLSHQLFQF